MNIILLIALILTIYVSVRKVKRLYDENEENRELANRLIRLINDLGNPPSPFNLEKNERKLFEEITREENDDTDIILNYIRQPDEEY